MRLLPPELTVSLPRVGQPALLESDELRAIGKWAPWEVGEQVEGKCWVYPFIPLVIHFFLYFLYSMPDSFMILN